MHKKFLFLVSLSVIFLIGAGCSETQKNTEIQHTSVVTQNTTNTTGQNQLETPQNSELILTATAVGNNAVDFEWKIGDEAANSSEGWRILYGTEPNPTYPSIWWFERSKPHRQKLWSGLPAGHGYFRLCQVIGDACMIYSNTVEVDIPGQEMSTSTQETTQEQTKTLSDGEIRQTTSTANPNIAP